MQYKVYRLEDEGTTTLVSEHPDIDSGIRAGKELVEQLDFDYPYALQTNGTRLATFAAGRIGYREWARRSGRLHTIHSLDDRYEKDVDELIG